MRRFTLAIALFGLLLERRHGAWAPLLAKTGRVDLRKYL